MSDWVLVALNAELDTGIAMIVLHGFDENACGDILAFHGNDEKFVIGTWIKREGFLLLRGVKGRIYIASNDIDSTMFCYKMKIQFFLKHNIPVSFAMAEIRNKDVLERLNDCGYKTFNEVAILDDSRIVKDMSHHIDLIEILDRAITSYGQ